MTITEYSRTEALHYAIRLARHDARQAAVILRALGYSVTAARLILLGV